jgi:ABC-type polysaccharide/polyol phosphate export permease
VLGTSIHGRFQPASGRSILTPLSRQASFTVQIADIQTTSPKLGVLTQFRLGLTHTSFRRAVDDILDGARRYGLWGTMGLQDIRHRYRRSVIGPFWLTISMGIMVGALGLLYGTIFKQEMHDYLPYLAGGFVVWGLISSLILEGANAFIAGEGLIKQLSAPLSIYVYRVAWSHLIIFFHNIWIVFIAMLWYGKSPGWSLMLVFPALVLVLMNGLWMGLLFGLLSARFRDIPQIIASVVQVMFFLTPIIWKPSMIPGRPLILDLNPFYYFVEIVRKPILGTVPDIGMWLGLLLITVVGWGIALFFYTIYRWRLAYWV